MIFPLLFLMKGFFRMKIFGPILLLLVISIEIMAQEIYIEAEDAQLINGAKVVNSSLCSGGRKVGYIGDSNRNGGVVFNFEIDEEDYYNINIHYVAGEKRSFRLIFNNDIPEYFEMPSTGSWEIPGIYSVRKYFKSGLNTLQVDNDLGYGPDLDVLIITKAIKENSNESDTVVFSLGEWKLKFYKNSGKTDLFKKQKLLLKKNSLAFNESNKKYHSGELRIMKILETHLEDKIGTGKKVVVESISSDSSIQITQNYYLYYDEDFVLTDFSIKSGRSLFSNYMAPVYSFDTVSFLPDDYHNKSIFVPFDNDKWIRYNLLDFGTPLSSYEVSCLFNTNSREALIIGSVEHDIWKSGIRVSTLADNTIFRVEAYGGASSSETRDILPHGKIKGKEIKSPLMMIGLYKDWRKGFEKYGDINEKISRKLPWNKGKIFGWNSWGAIQTNLSLKNATEVSDFFATYLQPGGFNNDSTVYIGLDSYWDNISYSDLIKFVKDCNAKNQNAGIYWTPFVDWAKNPERIVEGSNGIYYKDIYLYANGKPQEIAGAYAIDPTHPATKRRADVYLNRFITQGFTYLKLDFLSHGALESDHYYDTTVFTGIQAYNQGMKYITDYLNGKMYINLSISPLFPSQYGNSRRIACDAYASINDTEYTLNSLTYGWWLDHVYTFNDADNVVLNGVSTGENRARVTSSIITGIFISGDDFSSSGTSTAKTRAMTFLTNREVNYIARMTKAFYPVETGSGNSASEIFMQTLADTIYIALFNYSNSSVTKEINFERIGLKKGNTYTVHELWSNVKYEKTDSWQENIPRKDVKLFKIYPGPILSNYDNLETNNITLYPNPCTDHLYLINYNGNDVFSVYSYLGTRVKVFNGNNNGIYVGDLTKGLYFLVKESKERKYLISNFIKN